MIWNNLQSWWEYYRGPGLGSIESSLSDSPLSITVVVPKEEGSTLLESEVLVSSPSFVGVDVLTRYGGVLNVNKLEYNSAPERVNNVMIFNFTFSYPADCGRPPSKCYVKVLLKFFRGKNIYYQLYHVTHTLYYHRPSPSKHII